jgi:hypothetical protein
MKQYYTCNQLRNDHWVFVTFEQLFGNINHSYLATIYSNSTGRLVIQLQISSLDLGYACKVDFVSVVTSHQQVESRVESMATKIHPFDNYVTNMFWSWILIISKLRKVIGLRFMRARLPGQMTQLSKGLWYGEQKGEQKCVNKIFLYK